MISDVTLRNVTGFINSWFQPFMAKTCQMPLHRDAFTRFLQKKHTLFWRKQHWNEWRHALVSSLQFITLVLSSNSWSISFWNESRKNHVKKCCELEWGTEWTEEENCLLESNSFADETITQEKNRRKTQTQNHKKQQEKTWRISQIGWMHGTCFSSCLKLQLVLTLWRHNVVKTSVISFLQLIPWRHRDGLRRKITCSSSSWDLC